MDCAGKLRSRRSKSPPEGWKQWRSKLITDISAYYVSDDVPEEDRTGRCTLLDQVDAHVDLVDGLLGDISVSNLLTESARAPSQTTNP